MKKKKILSKKNKKDDGDECVQMRKKITYRL